MYGCASYERKTPPSSYEVDSMIEGAVQSYVFHLETSTTRLESFRASVSSRPLVSLTQRLASILLSLLPARFSPVAQARRRRIAGADLAPWKRRDVAILCCNDQTAHADTKRRKCKVDYSPLGKMYSY